MCFAARSADINFDVVFRGRFPAKNYYHGFPPGHEKHESVCAHNRPSPELYEATVVQMKMHQERGCKVRYIWEDEYKKTTTKKCPAPIGSLVHDFVE